MEISINGIQYEPIPEEKPKGNTRISAYVIAMLALYCNIGASMFKSSKSKQLPTRDIVGEFKLIQEKKSNLSRAERELVVREFNKQFRIKTP